MATKVLIISFYFPPAGGGGVQRWLKLAGYLPGQGIETHVLAPDDSRSLQSDPELEIPADVHVHRARYVGPSGIRPGEQLLGQSGLRRLWRRLLLTPRRLLVPDENVSWVASALPAARRIVKREGIDVVVTTSPPTSTHLIGARLRRRGDLRWIADLRDSVVAKSDRHYERALVRLNHAGYYPGAEGMSLKLVVDADLDTIATASYARAMTFSRAFPSMFRGAPRLASSR